MVAGIAESVVAVDTAAGTVVLAADTVVVVVVAVVLASLAVFDSYHKTSHQRLPEHRTWDTDTPAASHTPFYIISISLALERIGNHRVGAGA